MSKGQRIYRNQKKSNYTIINNEVLKRKDVSWKAKGIMAYILSLPDDWEIYLDEVMKHATDGRASFRSGWQELKDEGYVRQRQEQGTDGKFGKWITEITESVDLEPFSPKSDYPTSENPKSDKPISDNRTLLSTKELSTEELNTDSNNDDDNSAQVAALTLWENIYGFPNTVILHDIFELIDEIGDEMVAKAIEETARRDIPGNGAWNYAKRIIGNWKKLKLVTPEDVDRYQAKWEKQQEEKFNKKNKPPRKETLPGWATEEAGNETPLSEKEQLEFEEQLKRINSHKRTDD